MSTPRRWKRKGRAYRFYFEDGRQARVMRKKNLTATDSKDYYFELKIRDSKGHWGEILNKGGSRFATKEEAQKAVSVN